MERIRLLGVETSSPVFSVALSEGDRIIHSLTVDDARRPDAVLTELIRRVAGGCAGGLPSLEGFALSIGPGGFTGLRVGVMTVKTLAWALKKPVLPISSLEVIAQNHAHSAWPVALFLDARKSKVYTALFSPNGSGTLRRLREDQLLLPEEALKGMDPKTVLVGDGTQRYAKLISSEGDFTLTPPSTWIPSAESLCRIAAARWPEGKVDDPHSLVPQYLHSKESDITGK